MKVLMMAGEVSGDYQGSFLARALREQRPDVELFGTGGAHMRGAGVELRHEMAHLSSVGFLEPVRHVFPLKSIYRDMTRLVRSERPDLAVLIDNPGFNLAVGKVLKSLGVPVVFYFPPQIWVGPFLFARTVARISRVVISAFPREAEIYRSRYGANAVSYGHPLLDIVKTGPDPDEALRRSGLDPSRPVMALMPGSRAQEIKELGAPMLQAAKIIAQRQPAMQFILPLAAGHVRAPVEAVLRESGMTGQVTLIEGDSYTCLSRCEVVLACSGTATLELALLQVPMVVAYRLDPLSHWLARRLSLTPYVAMPNVLLNDWVVPEIIQHRLTGEHFADCALKLIEDPALSAQLRRSLAAIPSHLGSPGAVSRAAARIIEEAATPRGA
jgi:lipid-A-disaccharide synthase